jgi:hypothetical protein
MTLSLGVKKVESLLQSDRALAKKVKRMTNIFKLLACQLGSSEKRPYFNGGDGIENTAAFHPPCVSQYLSHLLMIQRVIAAYVSGGQAQFFKGVDIV